MNSAKTLVVGRRVAVAQAGTFTGTAEVLDELEKMDPTAATPEAVADLIRRHAGAIYTAMVARGADPVLRYLVAGLEPDNTPVIHSVEIDRGKANIFRGSGQIAALGTLANAHQIATQAVIASLMPMSNLAKLDEWVQRVVRAETAASPTAVGFAATLVVIRFASLIEVKVEEDAPHDSRLVGHFL